jgi:hypothetical protein
MAGWGPRDTPNHFGKRLTIERSPIPGYFLGRQRQQHFVPIFVPRLQHNCKTTDLLTEFSECEESCFV